MYDPTPMPILSALLGHSRFFFKLLNVNMNLGRRYDRKDLERAGGETGVYMIKSTVYMYENFKEFIKIKM